MPMNRRQWFIGRLAVNNLGHFDRVLCQNDKGQTVYGVAMATVKDANDDAEFFSIVRIYHLRQLSKQP